MSENKLVLKNVCKVFGDKPEEALARLAKGQDKATIFEETGQTLGVVNASFEVNAGEIFVIMGLSGSGKSTLVRLLNRLIEPSSGEILVDGDNILNYKEKQLRQFRREKMSMVFQSFALMPHMNILENTCFGLTLNDVEKETAELRAKEALDQVGLLPWIDSYPDELSGGMQQRVGLARALANDPEILLMDEAFSALDPLIRSEMQDELLKLQANNQRTIIFISHDLDEALKIGDRIAIMEGGRVVQVGTSEEILKDPADDYVKSFFRNVDITHILTAGDICRRNQAEIIYRDGLGIRTVLQLLKDKDVDYGLVLDKQEKLIGQVYFDELAALVDRDLVLDNYIHPITPVLATEALSDIIGQVADSDKALSVVDEQGILKGSISRRLLLNTMDKESETEYN